MYLIIRLIGLCFDLYTWALIIYALMSWLPGAYDSSFGRFIIKIVKPYMDFFDRHIPPIAGISINVIIAVLVLNLVRRGLTSVLLWFV